MILHFGQNGYLPLKGIVLSIFRGVPIIYYKNIIEMLFCKNFNQENAKKYQSLVYESVKKNSNRVEAITFHEET